MIVLAAYLQAAGAAWRLKCALCWHATQSTDLAELVVELVNPEGVQSMKAGAEPLTFVDCQPVGHPLHASVKLLSGVVEDLGGTCCV